MLGEKGRGWMMEVPTGPLKPRPDGTHFGLRWDSVIRDGKTLGYFKDGSYLGMRTTRGPCRFEDRQLSAMMTRGRRASSGSARWRSSRTIHGTLPSPNKRKPSIPETWLSSVHPK